MHQSASTFVISFKQPTPNVRPMTAWTWCKSSFYYELFSNTHTQMHTETARLNIRNSFFPDEWTIVYDCACFILNYSIFNWLLFKQYRKSNMHYTYGNNSYSVYFFLSLFLQFCGDSFVCIQVICASMRIAGGLLTKAILIFNWLNIYYKPKNLLLDRLRCFMIYKLFIEKSEREERLRWVLVNRQLLRSFLQVFVSFCVPETIIIKNFHNFLTTSYTDREYNDKDKRYAEDHHKSNNSPNRTSKCAKWNVQAIQTHLQLLICLHEILWSNIHVKIKHFFQFRPLLTHRNIHTAID